MKWSEVYLKTLREKPAGAGIASHVLLLRSGFIYMSSQGVYLYNSLFLRSIQKISDIIRIELEKQKAREILMPMVQSRELWEQSGRWDKFEGLLLKMKGRTGTELCLGPTHEELIIDFVKSGLNSWRDMPLNLYQIQNKYRDEIRPRFGLMRAREFLMKDAYSFDTCSDTALQAYQKMFQAYQSVFNQLGVRYVVVKADPGSIGGSHSEEFHILADKGEDELLVCKDFSANVEICPRGDVLYEERDLDKNLKKIEEFATPNITTIDQLADFLSIKTNELVKILFFISQDRNQSALEDKAFAVLCLGDDEVSPFKLKKQLNLKEPPLLADSEAIQKITGAKPGSCGPYQLKIRVPVYLDNYLKSKKNFITGANKDGFHLKNVNPGRDFKAKAYGDFCFARETDLSPKGASFKKYRGIEVGHLFYLGDEYSKKMNLSYLDQEGNRQFVKMGCYGLGVTRTLQAIIEQKHDDKGMVWPLCVAPFAVHICLIDTESVDILKAQKAIVSILEKHSLDYFIDDRKERPGVKFKDADLIGLPLRINLGMRDLKNKQIEVSIRQTGEKRKINLSDLSAGLSSLIQLLNS